MICPKCRGVGRIPFGEEPEIYTKEEWLHTLNTEQLAEFLCEVWYGIDDVINIMSEDGEISKKDAMIQWLKQPHRVPPTEEQLVAYIDTTRIENMELLKELKKNHQFQQVTKMVTSAG